MARSQDAMRKRAEKRNRSLPDQWKADSAEMRRQLEKEAAAKKQKLSQQQVGTTPAVAPAVAEPAPAAEKSTTTTAAAATSTPTIPSEMSDALKEPGAWKCPGCLNHNFASRNSCHSKMCFERRPGGINPSWKKPARHDPRSSKTLHWAKQADAQGLAQNQDLRKQFKENPEGMDEVDRERAKILIARDERKKAKKSGKTMKKDRTAYTPKVVPAKEAVVAEASSVAEQASSS